MKTVHCLLGTLGLLSIVLAGCSSHTDSPAVAADTSFNEPQTPSGVTATDSNGATARETPSAPVVIEGQPVSKDPIAVENEDARVGDRADRTGANPQRIPDIEIKNLSKDGNIWVGGEPTDKGYRQVHERGVTAIVDLRNPTAVQKQSAEEARRLGMDYVNLPIEPKNMDPKKATAFLDFMRHHEGEQVLIHCGSANRASGMYAVYLGAVKGLSTDEAVRHARRTGLREQELEDDVRRYLDDLPAPARDQDADEPAERD